MLDIIDANEALHPVIRSIAYQTWPDTFAAILTPAQIQYMLEQMYSPAALLEQTQQKGHQFLVAKLDTTYLGFTSIEHHYEGAAQTKIHKIYILPEAQGRGVGKALFAEITKRALQMGNQKLILNVNRNNQAVHFYEGIGFQVIKTEDIDIGHGYFMNDYVMEKSLL